METLSRLVVAFLLNSLWQVTLLAGIATFCALLMRNTPARYRHALWVMALGVAVLLPLSSPRQFKLRVNDSVPLQPQSSTVPNLAVESPGFIQMDDPADSPYVRWLRKHIRGLNRWISLAPFWLYTLAGGYSLFLLYRLTRLWRAWRKTNDIRRTACAREIPEWMALIAARCQVALGLGNSLGQAHRGTSPRATILCSSQVAGPLTCGARRPAIILPERLFEGPPSEDFTSALCHEMAHIRRHDFLLNLIYELIYLPLSFHPAAMLIKRRIDETRELTCDEMAAGRLLDPVTYARSLVSIARSMSLLGAPRSLSGPGYTLGVFDANILEERIMRLLNKRPRASARLAKISLLLGSLLLAASCIAASAFSLSVVQETESETADAAERFLGTWEGKCQGKTFVIVRLKRDGQNLTGAIGIAHARGDENGQCVEVMDEPTSSEFAQPITDAKVRGSKLSFRGAKRGDDGDLAEFEMKLTGDKTAELTYVNAAHGVRPTWKIIRESNESQNAPGSAQKSEPGSIFGTVLDASGARVPHAVVLAVNEDTGIIETTAVADAGEFSFPSLPPGHYRLEVASPGFAPYRGQHYVLGPGVTQRLRVALEPASVTQFVVVTGKAAPGTPAKTPDSVPRRIRVGGLVQTTKQLEAPKPQYPESARAKGVQGIVLLQAVISKEGAPLSLKVLSSPDPDLSSAAMDAVRQWRYEPTRLNGEPIEVVTTIAVRFHLAP